MNYQNYDDYMRSVLGYSPYQDNNYTYTNEQEDLYSYSNNDTIATQETSQDLTMFYPEIYKIIYPMVCKACNMNTGSKLTRELLEQMTDEIYQNVEPEQENEQSVRTQAPLKNGDVRNPNAKEPVPPVARETRQNNFLLRDLIRILLLREWGRPQRPPFRPPFRPGGRPPMGPTPPPRPRYY